MLSVTSSVAECDALVVGAGPGGSSCAFALARMGWHVILAERQCYPADKLCGEFLSADGVDVLRRLGMWTGLGGEGLPRISGVALSASDGSSWTSQLPEAGLGCSRLRLDCALMVACRDVGVQVCEGMRVRQVDGDFEGGFRVLATGADGQKEFRVKLVVAAYGKSGRLSGERGQPQQDRRGSRSNQLMALKVHINADDAVLRLLSGKVELHGFPGGYAGLCEVEGNKVNLCLLTQVARFRESGSTCDRFSSQWMTQNSTLAARLEMLQPDWAGSLAQANLNFGTLQRPLSRVLYLGDAAGSITPLCGNGMSMALRSAELISSQIDRFLQGNLAGSQLLRTSNGLWRGEFRRRVRLGQLLQWVLLGGGKRAGRAIRLLGLSPAVGKWLIRQTRGSP